MKWVYIVPILYLEKLRLTKGHFLIVLKCESQDICHPSRFFHSHLHTLFLSRELPSPSSPQFCMLTTSSPTLTSGTSFGSSFWYLTFFCEPVILKRVDNVEVPLEGPEFSPIRRDGNDGSALCLGAVEAEKKGRELLLLSENRSDN